MSARPRTPLIVCGFPRSGTWGCAHVLGNSREIELQGEMARPDETLAYLETIKTHWAGQGGDKASRGAAKAYDLAFDVFKGVSASVTSDRPASRYAGHKTPRHERYFDRYEALFDDPAARPVYVYCLRNPFDVWRSQRAMPWNRLKSEAAFARAWTESTDALAHMRARAGDRVITVNLDALKAAPDARAWWMRTVFTPLGLTDAGFIKPIAEVRMTNAAEAKLGQAPAPLTNAERARIAADPKVRAVLEAEFAGLIDWPDAPLKRGWWR